jgi:integrase
MALLQVQEMSKVLTARGIEKLRPGRREVPDAGCPGLYVVIGETGHKSFALRSRSPSGKTFKLTLGGFTTLEVNNPAIGGPLTLAAARQLATALLHDRARGVDIAGRRRAEKLALVSGNGATFGHAVEDFITQYAMRETRGPEETARLLGLRIIDRNFEVISKGLVDRWRDRAITEVTSDDIFALIEECRERGVPGMEVRNEGPSDNRALAMFARLSKLFGWLLSKRRIKANPCIGIARTKPPKARDRTLKDEEIVAFWSATEHVPPAFCAALKLLLLTGQRLTEVTDMRRSELSDDLTTWTVPGERTKNHREHVVPLSPMAREILAAIPVAGEYVLTTTNGRKPIIINTKIRDRLTAATGGHWRLHDLRRTVVTGMAELGVRPDVIELVVNHVSGHRGGIAGVYNRSEMLPERRAALERWAAHVEGLVYSKAAKVVLFNRVEA